MLEYDRINISEGIDVDKTDKSKECMFCHYWYILNKKFKYGCYDIVQKSTDFKNITIVHVRKNAYRVYFPYMNKYKAKKLINKFNLIDKTESIQL